MIKKTLREDKIFLFRAVTFAVNPELKLNEKDKKRYYSSSVSDLSF
jgi:hypothetical protein